MIPWTPDERFWMRIYADSSRVLTRALPFDDSRAWISYPAQLRVFSNDVDKVVARDADDAWAVWEESTGEKREDYDEDFEWEPVPPLKVMTIWEDTPFDRCDCRARKRAHDEKRRHTEQIIDRLPEVARGAYWKAIEPPLSLYPNGHVIGCRIGATTLTAAAWAASTGRGFLCSTEY